MADGKLNDMIGTSLSKIRELADAETVIGDPIVTASGTTIIPVSKVSIGYASGGIDYNGKQNKSGDTKQNFGGGGGTGLSVTPIAFLVIGADGNANILPITQASDAGTVDKVTSLIERSPDILERLKKVFTKKEKKPAEPTDPASEEPAEAGE